MLFFAFFGMLRDVKMVLTSGTGYSTRLVAMFPAPVALCGVCARACLILCDVSIHYAIPDSNAARSATVREGSLRVCVR